MAWPHRDGHDAGSHAPDQERQPHRYETTLTRKVRGWVWRSIVFGGLIGLAVDAISGGLYNLTPEQVSGTLLANSSRVAPMRDGLYVMVSIRWGNRLIK